MVLAMSGGIFIISIILSVPSAHTGITLLGVNVIGFVFNVVITLYVFPVRILGLENLSNTGLKYQGGMNTSGL